MDGRLSLSQKHAIRRFIGSGGKNFNLLYSFTRDGAAATTFHQRCDNRGPTVTVIYNTKGSVYGGYIEKSWVSGIGEAYVEDDGAFLFRLMSKNTVALDKFPVKNSHSAFYCNDSYGPVFGGSLTQQGPQYRVNGNMNMGNAYDMNVFRGSPTAQGQQYPVCGRMNMGNAYDMNGFYGNLTAQSQQYPVNGSRNKGSAYDMNVFSGSLTAQGSQYTVNGSMNMGSAYDMNGISTAQVTDNIKTVLDVEVYSVSESHFENIWRETPGWELKDLEDLKHFASSFVPPHGLGIDMANILIIGPVGAGKSSFFNTIASVFRGNISDQAICGSAEKSITTKYQMYNIRGSQMAKPLKFCLWDTMGLEESQGLDTQELTYILDGHVPDGYQFNPMSPISSDMHGFVTSPTLGKKIHCVCFVFDGNTATILSEKMLDKVKSMQVKLRQKGLPQAIVLTKVDNVCSYVEEDVKNVYQSDTIKQLVNKVSNIFGIPRSFILPLKNYEKEFDVKTDVSVLAMQTLKRLLLSTENHLFNVLDQYEKKQKSTDSLE